MDLRHGLSDLLDAEAYKLIQSCQIDEILELPQSLIRCLLPLLVRYALLEESRKANLLISQIKRTSGIPEYVNEVIALYEQVDFERIANDAIKELRWRTKLADTGELATHSSDAAPDSYVGALAQRGSLTSVFERSDWQTKVRIVLSELLRTSSGDSSRNATTDDLFASFMYTETISNIVSVIYTELLPAIVTNVQPVTHFDESAFLSSVLRMRYGTTIIIRLVLNCPSAFDFVCAQVIDALVSSACVTNENTRGTDAGSKTTSSRAALLVRTESSQLLQRANIDNTSRKAEPARRCGLLLRALAKLGGPAAARRLRQEVCVAARRTADRAVEELVLALTLDLVDACEQDSSTCAFAFDCGTSRDGLDELLSFISCALLSSTSATVRSVSDITLQPPTAVAEAVGGALFEAAPSTPRSASRRRTSLVTDAASPPRERERERERDSDLRSPKAARLDRDVDPRSPKAASSRPKGPSVSFQDVRDRLFAFAAVHTTRLADAPRLGLDNTLHTLRDATRLVRVLVALKLSGAVARLAEDELSALLALLTVRVELDATAPSIAPALDAFSTLSVCALVALCGQLVSAEQERRVADWLAHLVQGDSPHRTECVETLLVLALHCHAVNVGTGSEQQSGTAAIAWSNLNAFVTDLFVARFGVARGFITAPRANQFAKAVRLIVRVLTDDVLAHCLERFDYAAGRFVPPLACVTQLVVRAGRTDRDRAANVADRDRSALPIGAWLVAHIVRAHEQLTEADDCARGAAVQQLIVAIDAYVSALSSTHYAAGQVGARGSVARARVEPIREDELLGHFDELVLFRFGHDQDATERADDEPLCVTKHVLLAYYLLALHDAYLEQLAKLGTTQLNAVQQPSAHAATLSSVLNGAQVATFTYSDRLLADVPIAYLVRRARADRASFAACLPKLLRIAVARRPEVRDVDARLFEPFDSLDPPLSRVDLADTAISFSDWSTAFDRVLRKDEQIIQRNRGEAHLIAMFDQLLTCVRMRDAYLVPLLRAIQATLAFLSRFLCSNLPANTCLFERIREAWLRVHAVAPRKLATLTARAFVSLSRRADDFVRDPLLVARCLVNNDRFVQLAACFEIFLKTLQTFVTASRVYCSELLMCNVPRVGPSAIGYQPNGGLQPALAAALGRKLLERDELGCALLQSQQAAIVHLLIELCCVELPGRAAPSNHAEIRPLACAYLHSAFIEEPQLIKLVHFQGYPLQAIDTLVRFVPSLHCALEFVPELLAQPHRDTQLFAVRLAACLAQRYAVPRAAQNARLCIELMFTLLGADRLSDRVAFFTRAVDALGQFAAAFPPLAADCARLLVAVARSCCPLQLRTPAAFDKASGCHERDCVLEDEIIDETEHGQRPVKMEVQQVDTNDDDEQLPELLNDDASRLYTRIRRCYAEICKRATMLQYLI